MEYVAFFISFIYILRLLIEKIIIDKYRKQLKHVIHINGSFKKSMTLKLIHKILNENNICCVAKTSGKNPMYIDPFGIKHIIKRKKILNIREQLRTLKKSYKDNASVLIIEALDMTDDLQTVTQEKILKTDISIITNILLNKNNENLDDLNKIAKSFCSTIPTDGVLFLNDKSFYNYFQEKSIEKYTKTIYVNSHNRYIDFCDDIYINLAVEVCKYIGAKKISTNCLKEYSKDGDIN